MRGFVEAVWIISSLIGLPYAILGVKDSRTDYLAVLPLQNHVVKQMFARSIYRSQSLRTVKLSLMLISGLVSAFAGDEIEWRTPVLLFSLLGITVLTATDAAMDKLSYNNQVRVLDLEEEAHKSERFTNE